MHRIAPGCLVCGDVALGALSEGHRLGRMQGGFLARVGPAFDRIDTLEQETAVCTRLLTSFGQRHKVGRSQADMVTSARPLVAEHPGASVVARDLQIGAVADGVSARRLERRDLPRCFHPSNPVPTAVPTACSRIVPEARGSARIIRLLEVLVPQGFYGRQRNWPDSLVAEGVGFEPTRGVNPWRFSRPLP